MVFGSEKEFKDRFPDFIDKTESSNFSKLISVLNLPFQKLNQRIDELQLITKLYRPILIQRVQEEPYKCSHTVYVDIEDVKNIKVYKNDELIDSVDFKLEEHVDEWEKTYEDISDKILVPDKYMATVETYNEFNYTAADGLYDNKIDTLGKFLDCPRIQFKTGVEEYDYPYTYPAYNIDEKEPDWYYLARMNEYISLLDGMPAPCLTIWKKYLITTELQNRSRLIAKVGEYTAVSEKNNPSIFNRFNTLNPFVNQTLTITSYYLNDELKAVAGQSAIYCRKEGEDHFKCIGYNKIDMEIVDDTIFEICSVYYSPESPLPPVDSVLIDFSNDVSSITEIVPRSSAYADYYVSTDGDDNNDGHTVETAFRTIEKAISMIRENDIIKILNGEYSLNNNVVLNYDCLITGEDSANTIIICGDYEFLIPPNKDNIRVNVDKLTFNKKDVDYEHSELTEYRSEGKTYMKIVGANRE